MAHEFGEALPCSVKWRGILALNPTQPRVVNGIDRICRCLGGVSRVWRFDRMATDWHPESGRITASSAGVTKDYGVPVAMCTPGREHRKGSVEKSNHAATQRWWRTLSDVVTVEQARARLDRFCTLRGDTRLHQRRKEVHQRRKEVGGDDRHNRGVHPMPATAYPAILIIGRVVSRQALASRSGNRYSVPPELDCLSVSDTGSGRRCHRHRHRLRRDRTCFD